MKEFLPGTKLPFRTLFAESALANKLADASVVQAAGVKAIMDAHLKQVGREYFRAGSPAIVAPWPDDDREDVCDDIGHDPLAVDDLESYGMGETDDSQNAI
jgi:hypothetical protein